MTCNININFTANMNYQILLSQEFLLQIRLYNPQYHSSSSIVSHAGIASSLPFAPPMWILELNESQQRFVLARKR